MRTVRGARPAGERGSATVETALVMPVIVMMILLVLLVARIGMAQLAVTEGARAAARALSAGESPEAARAVALRVCQCSATVNIADGSWVRVEVRSAVPAMSWLPGMSVAARLELPSEQP